MEKLSNDSIEKQLFFIDIAEDFNLIILLHWNGQFYSNAAEKWMNFSIAKNEIGLKHVQILSEFTCMYGKCICKRKS